MGKDDEEPSWRASGVKGVVPPGRKLPSSKPSTAPWRGTGVSGIQLPAAPGKEEEDSRWSLNRKPARRPAPRPKPQTAAAQRKVKPANTESTPALKIFLDEIAGFFRENEPHESASESLSELISQSHAPYEIITGFAILSTLVGQDAEKRSAYGFALERGARAYFNLAQRLDKNVKAPRGLMPQSLDPLFYDLPATAFQIPYAFVTEAYLRVIELLQQDPSYNRKLIGFGEKLYAEHIEGQRYGDEELSKLFPWARPHWAPEPQT